MHQISLTAASHSEGVTMLLQISLTFIATLTVVHGIPPPGYKPKPQEPDPHPPKYEYGYNIADEKGTKQGKMESRDGIYAQGRYYVQGKSSAQNVEYSADDWGYHPYVEYSNVGPNSKTVTQIALGKEAIETLRKSKEISTKLRVEPTEISPAKEDSVDEEQKPETIANKIHSALNQPSKQSQQQIIDLPSPTNTLTYNTFTTQENLQVSKVPLTASNAIIRTSPSLLQSQLLQKQPLKHINNVPNSSENQNQQNVFIDLQSVENLQSKQSQESNLQNQLLNQKIQFIDQSNTVTQKSVNFVDVPQILQQQIEINPTQSNLLDQSQQVFLSNKVLDDGSNEARHILLVNQPQQIYLQPAVQEEVSKLESSKTDEQKSIIENIQSNINKQIINGQRDIFPKQLVLKTLQAPIQQNTFLNSQDTSQTSLNSQSSSEESISNNGNVVITKSGPLIFLNQEELNRGILILSPYVQSKYQFEDRGNNLLNVQTHNEKSAQLTINHSDLKQNLLEVTKQIDNPIALPLIYENIPQGEIINSGNNENQPQLTNTLKNELISQNSINFIKSLNAEENLKDSEQIATAALFESGADLAINEKSSEHDNFGYSGSYGEKINKLINQPNVTKYKGPSKLIESTRDLITGFDVLSINDAAENNIATAAGLVGNLPQQTLSTLRTTSEKEINNLKIFTTTPSSIIAKETVTPLSLLNNPIIVADYENENVNSSNFYYDEQKEIYSSTQNTVDEIQSHVQTTDATIIVTPRPIHSKFLAPITAGVQLQNAEQNSHKTFLVEVQESVPYYVGKYEYIQNSKFKNDGHHEEVIKDLNLGKTLINFPINHEIRNTNSFESTTNTISNSKTVITSNIDQQQEQGQIQQITLPVEHTQSRQNSGDNINFYSNGNQEESQELPQKLIQTEVSEQNAHKTLDKILQHPIEKIVEKPVHVPVEVTKYVDRPYAVHVPVAQPVPYPVEKIVEKYINRPYPVHVPVHIPVQIPVTIEKKIPVPYPIEKIIEKPVTKIVEKPVPQPYTIEKVIEKKVPVEVTKYIDRPYPVVQPYPVERIVEKVINKPYPVPVQVPVPQPYPVEKKIPIEVNKYIDRPYPIKIPVVQTYPAGKIINKVSTKFHPIQILIPQNIPVQNIQQSIQHPTVTQSFLLPINVKNSVQTSSNSQTNDQSDGRKQNVFISNPYLYAPNYQTAQEQIDKNIIAVNNNQGTSTQYSYLVNQPTPAIQQAYKNLQQTQSYLVYGAPLIETQQNCQPLNKNEYIGLVPPKDPRITTNALKKRQAKSSFESPKLEYGFLPPLIPSQEIDENGKPIENESS